MSAYVPQPPNQSNGATGAKPYVVYIDNDVARLQMPDGSVKEVPAAQLPPGQQANSFLNSDDDALAFSQKPVASPYEGLLKQMNGGATSSQPTGGIAAGSKGNPNDLQRLLTMLGQGSTSGLPTVSKSGNRLVFNPGQ